MRSLIKDLSASACIAGMLTFFVGISVSAVLVLQAAQQLGANMAQTNSWFWSLGIGIGLCGLLLSYRFKYPVITSWSTAGLALILASAHHYSLPEALGAFLLCGLLTAILGFTGVLNKLLDVIPPFLTSAMLAGILLNFGIQLFSGLQQNFGFILSVLVVYVLSKKWLSRYTLVFTAGFAIVSCWFFIPFNLPEIEMQITQPVWIEPEFSLQSVIGLGLPLLVINMASQYLPGLAMIQSYGYPTQVKSLIGWTGLSQALLAPFGCFSVNTAAISAGISLDEQCHSQAEKRYIAGLSCGLCYLLFALFASTFTQILLAFPALLMTTLAGIALFATLSHHLNLAFSASKHSEAVLITFLCSASGVELFGIGSAFWGLILGMLIYRLFHTSKPVS